MSRERIGHFVLDINLGGIVRYLVGRKGLKMAAKLLHSLTEDNLDLQKQIGCMSGIFHLFDRPHLLTGGISDYNGGSLERESNDERLRPASTEKIPLKKSSQEKQRVSTESSRVSFSSLSRSSSSSSLDCNRATDRITFPEIPSMNRDLRDLVKDSMYQHQGLSFKDKTAEEAAGLDTKQRIQDDLNESLRVVANERRELLRSLSYHSRDGSSSLISRDAPRFSYDGNRAPFDSRDASKSTLKLKDLPRLSLDGSNNFLASMQQDSKVQNLKQARPPSVVAKLMGLETLPHSVDTKSYPVIDVSRSFAVREASSVKPLSSSKNLWKDPNSPRWRNSDTSMKPLSRFPIEPAPWKQTDGRRSSLKPRSTTMRSAAKAEAAAFPSVYSEIEKRLKDLEFTQSGKDLRALKQILEAMQSKKSLQTTPKEVLGTRHKDHEVRFKHEARSVNRRKPQTAIVIMKPSKPLEGLSGVTKLQDNEFVDSRKGLRTGKDVSSKSSHRQSAATSANMKNDTTLKATQTSTRSQQLAKDGYAGSISPRMQQKKLELERRARPPTPPDSSKSRRQPNKQLGESNSPGGRRRPRHSSIHESLVQSNASESMLSDSAEQISTIALNEEKSAEFGVVPVEYSSPVSVLDNRIHKYDSPSWVRYKVEISMDKLQKSCADIDILSSREYGFTSEVNQNKLQNIENLVQKLRRLSSSNDEAGTDYIASLCENTDPDHRYISEILLASGLLLRDLGSSLMDFQFHPSGHPINPELFLVLEQTKASTVLKEEHIPVPEMMIKGKLRRKLVFDTVNEILARKLMSPGPSTEPPWLRPLKLTRTALNAQKLLRELCSEIEALQYSSDEEDGRWKGVVCKDVMYYESERWTGFDDEISGAVLDIERSIFKDLVNEIVIGESSAGLKTKPAGRRRAFAN